MASNSSEMVPSSSTELTKFLPYPRLPRELKDRVWGHSLEGRLIKISMSSTGLGRYLILPGGGTLSQPSVLQVDSITRKEFLKRYPWIFEGRYRQMGAYGHLPVERKGIRYNSDVDALAYHHCDLEDTPAAWNSRGASPFFTTVQFLFVASQADLEHITSLAITEVEMQSIITEGHTVRNASGSADFPDTFTRHDLVQCLRKLPNLETLLVVFRDAARVDAWTHALTAYEYTDPIVYTKGIISQAEKDANMNLVAGEKAWKAPIVGSVIKTLPARHPRDNSKLTLDWHWARDGGARIVERLMEVKFGKEDKKMKAAEEAKKKAKVRVEAKMDSLDDDDAITLEEWSLDNDEEEDGDEEIEADGYDNDEDLTGLHALSL